MRRFLFVLASTGSLGGSFPEGNRRGAVELQASDWDRFLLQPEQT